MKTKTFTDHKIKSDTFCRIAKLALSQRRISRAELAQRAGTSKVTVGKAVELLGEAGQICACRAEFSRGRHAELISPSPSLRAAVLCLDGNSCRTAVTDFEGNVIFSKKKRISDSLTLDDNIEIALDELRDREELGSSFVVGAVGYGVSASADRATDGRFERSLIVAQKIQEALRFKNVLYLGVSDALRIQYHSRTGSIVGEQIRNTPTSFEGLLGYIDELIVATSLFSRPDTVLIESDSTLFDLRFAELVRERVRLRGCELLFYENMEFTVGAVLDRLIDAYAEDLTARLFS